MEEPSGDWWRRHALTVVLLVSAAGLAIFLRTAWMYPLVQQFGSANLFGGGSDSFYHFDVSYYIAQNHQNLIHDSNLNYPVGAINPREPLFDWMNGVLAILFAGAWGGNLKAATSFFLEAQGPIWAGLGIFPLYLIGKEISNRRVGILAGFLYAISVGNIDSSTFAYANYLSFYTFFILLSVYGYLRTIRASGTRRWVESYRHPRAIVQGLRGFLRTERTAVRWAVFAGVCFGALALAWQGFTFFVAAAVVFLVIALIIERIRRVDSFGLYVSTWIVGLVGFGMALPYYYVQGLAPSWFGLPLLVFAGGLLLALPLVLLRDSPWVVSIPVFLAVGVAGVLSLDFVSHAQFENIVTGQGYFAKTLIYSTVAEAQAPSIDALILGYGVITFFVAFVGLGLWVWRTIRGRFPRVLLFGLVFAAISIYLPISAAKFFYLGSAAFALLPAEAIVLALDIAGLPKLRRTISQLSDRGGQLGAFRRSFKVRNAVVLLAVLGLLLPNVWYAIDAGIPYNNKAAFDNQVFDTLPPYLQTSPGNASSFYLGADGTELDTPPQYDEAGYNWLSQQDTNLTPADRPAFISWWDYGFQAIAQGDHPSVADNFQNGIDPSGNFLLSQNESLAIGVLATTLILAEQRESGDATLPAGLNAVLARDHVDLGTLHKLLTQPGYDVQLVVSDPNRYVAVDPAHIDGENAMYDAVSWELASTRSVEGMAVLYDDIQAFTHWTIRYAMVDNRLFPFSGQSTGIFYAPADLTDRVISSGGIPTSYFQVSITGSDGNTYPYGALPAGVSPTAYPIAYYPAFYNTMLYHIFAGYNGTEVGQTEGIPGVTGSIASSPPMPGWMEQHFQLVYQTAYFCPFSNPNAHPGCAVAMNLPEANKLAKKDNGSVEASMSLYAADGGEMILAYYPGQPVTGTVSLPDGTPVPGARVTVYDSFHIPHMTVTTGTNGVYTVILPPGNDTLNVTTGAFNPVSQADTTVLESINESISPVYGYSLDAPTLVQSIVLKPGTVTGVVYVNTAGNSTYQASVDPIAAGATVNLYGPTGVYHATTDASGTYRMDRLAPGQYNMTVVYQGTNSTNSTLGPVYAQAGKVVNRSFGIGPGTISGHVTYPNGTIAVGATVTVTGATGVATSASVDSSGNYSIASLPAGNVTVTAFASGGSYRIEPLALNLSTGKQLHENLSLDRFATISLTVLSGGSPIGGVPVRFAPIVPFATHAPNVTTNGSAPPPSPPGGLGGTPGGGTGPIGTAVHPEQNGSGSGPGGSPGANGSADTTSHAPTVTPATVNSSVFVTSPDGTITASLPVGNYSIYALGLSNGRWVAGIATAGVNPGYNALSPISLAPAQRLSGVTLGGSPSSSTSIQILAYNPSGQVVWTFSNASNDWGMLLPAGPYSVWAVQAPSAGASQALAQVASVNLTGPTSITLPMAAATLYQPFVATNGATAGSQVPIPGASVNITVPYLGLRLSERANASGNVTYWLPNSFPMGASICLSVGSPGYLPTSSCNVNPLGLANHKLLGLTPANLTESVAVSGLPGGVTATLNFTVPGRSTPNFVLHGVSTTSISITPGTYQVTGWTTYGSAAAVFSTVAPVNVTVPVGGPAPAVLVPLVAVVSCVGVLTLPVGLSPSNVSVVIYGNGVNETISGAKFQGTNRLPSGSYTILANGASDNTSYVAFTRTSFNLTGVENQPIALLPTGASVTFNLTLNGAPLNGTSLPALISGAGGLRLPVEVLNGRYVNIFPIGSPLSLSVHATRLLPNAAGTTSLEEVSDLPHAPPCLPLPPETICPVPLLGSPILSAVAGELRIPGFPNGVAGTIDFIGPGTSSDRTPATAGPNGSFIASLPPGAYTIYAHSVEGSSAYANLTPIVVPALPIGPVVISLSPAWTASITVRAPPGVTSSLGTTVLVQPAAGFPLPLPNVSFGAPISVVVPSGAYTISANATGSPYGVAATATGSVALSLYQGNGAVTIPLAWQWQRTVQFHVPGTVYQLGDGGTARIGFSVVNSGNIPFSVHFVGTPSTYNISFSPANATLGLSPTNDSVAGTVTVTVPAGSPVEHPPIQLEAVVDPPFSTAAGFATPAPSIDLTPVYRLVGGPGAAGSSDEGPRNVSVSFYLSNPGNAIESVSLGLADALRVKGIGWTASFSSGSGAITAPVSVDPGANSSYTLTLAGARGALPPGTVTVIATVLNGTGGLRVSIPLAIPTTGVTLTSGTLSVTGPSLGSPPTYPDWLVPVLSFVPAIALAGAILAFRWYRTRRWVRR